MEPSQTTERIGEDHPDSDAPVHVVNEKTYSDALVTDQNGNILANCFQQDMTIRRRQWSDGTYDIIDDDTGRTILPRYNPNDEAWKPRCVHCGKDPFNE